MSEEFRFRADLADQGLRVDRFLDRQMEGSRSVIQRWIKEAGVRVNGSACKPGRRLRNGDEIEVNPLPAPPMDLLPEELPLSIVFEDEHLLVVDKAAGMVVHPGAGNNSGTLVNALLFHLKRMSRKTTVRPGIVHRLDKGTSGLLVVAKNDRSHDHLALQFKERQVTKLYLCLVYGRVEKEAGEIDIPVGRHPTRRTRMSTRSRSPRPAFTAFRVLRRLTRFSYLEVKLRTGRTHQIRVHLEHAGHPVVGDPVYRGNRRELPLAGEEGRLICRLERQFLHAATLQFEHPATGRKLRFESPLADDLAAVLSPLE